MIDLYQKSSSGNVKFHHFETNGAEFICTWGLLGGATQSTTKVCVGKNIGRSNETTPAEQAIAEMEQKTEKKMKEGYALECPTIELFYDKTPDEFDLDNLPKAFCPSKPISKMPDKVYCDPTAYGQRKHNGHCLILVKGKGPGKVYTRRMEDITRHVGRLPIIHDALAVLPEGTFLLHECVFYSDVYKKEMPRFVAQVIGKEDAPECRRRYDELSKAGTFKLIAFDALFLNNTFIGDKTHLERVDLLEAAEIKTPQLFFDWRELIPQAQKDCWEGFVVRQTGASSQITYSTDGKAKRAGGYKYKFTGEDDFVVDQVIPGESGKHAGFYAKFHVHQFDSNGNVVDRGFVGAGTLSHADLVQLRDDIDSGRRKVPFVVEIEYQSIHDESGKLEFGQIQRIREDKVPSECVCDD